MIKQVKYQNSSGFSLAFENRKPYYLEKIDGVGLKANIAAEELAFADGQKTVFKKFGARTVPVDFAVWLTEKDEQTDVLDYLISLFNPLDDGVLTLVNDKGAFSIECCPAEIPTFNRGNVGSVYRFTVDFVCDYPYFTQLGELNETITAGTPARIISNSVPDTPVRIYIPDCTGGATVTLSNRNGSAKIKVLEYTTPVFIDTKDFTAKAVNSGGYDISNKIDVSSGIEDFKLCYGKNEISISGTDTAYISWNKLVLGVK